MTTDLYIDGAENPGTGEDVDNEEDTDEVTTDEDGDEDDEESEAPEGLDSAQKMPNTKDGDANPVEPPSEMP